jgi:hexulose-6-phosphate isomerase
MDKSHSRREFLRCAGQTAATASLLCPVLSLPAGEAAKPRKLRPAIMYGTIGFKGTILEKFQALKAAGFEGVELMSHLDQDEVVRAMDATGLKAAGVCGALHWKKPLSDPDPAVREAGLEALKQTLRDAKRYGATSVLLVPGVAKEPVSYEQCFQRSLAEIKKALPLAEELNVKIGIENVGNNFITTPGQAIEYLDAFGSPLVGWHFDIGNVMRFSAPETWIRTLGKRIVKLHFKEYSKAKSGVVKFLEGDNQWPAIMKVVDEVGYSDWAITEQPGNQTADLESMKDFVVRLRKILAS